MDAKRKYLQNAISGNMNFYGKNIKAVKVPHIEQLSIKDLINWGIKSTDIDPYLKPTNTLTENVSECFKYIGYEGFQKSAKFITRKRENVNFKKKYECCCNLRNNRYLC